MDAGGDHRLAAGDVELHHRFDRRSEFLAADQVVLHRGAHDPRADAFRQVEHVARMRAPVAHDAIRVDRTEHAQAVLRLVVVDRMASGHERAGGMRGVGSPAQDLARHLRPELAVECEQVQGHMGLRAHREHVGKRVGPRNPPELVRVVHHGREEVDGEHRRGRVIQFPHRRVVARLEPEQELVLVGQVDRGRKAVQRFFEVSRTPLRRSTALAGQFGQRDFLFLAHGRLLFSSESIAAPMRVRAEAATPHLWRNSRSQG